MAINTVLVYTILALNIVSIHGDEIVQTKYGKVSGIKVNSVIPNESYYSFLGIPYAQPPVKELRFAAPRPHPGWTNVLEAKKEKKQCPQFNIPERLVPTYGHNGDEDCLHLSIHTPKLPNNEDLKLPVIVFFYNEHFKLTYNASKDYGPDFFMKEDVLLVTVNYRVGVFGFLSFQDDSLPGNNGLRDVILALKWLQDNIKSFGGDSSRVTLMGSQGGATLVDVLLHSPKAKGLFSAAILQSGSSWESVYFDDKARKRAIDLSEYLENKATTSSYLMHVLSELPAIKLTEAEIYVIHADEARSVQRGVIPFGPIAEHEHPDAVITESPEKNPKNIDVPVIIGYNSREGIQKAEHYLHKPAYLTFADRDFLMMFPKRVNYHFKINDKVYYDAIEEVKEFYFDEAYIKVSKPSEYMTYLEDVFVIYPIDYTVRAYTNVSSHPVYYYMFDYNGELNFRKRTSLEEAVTIEGTWGATTADELCYLFVCNPIRKSYKKLIEDNAEEISVINNMVRLWTNFAKTGSPSKPEDQVIWKPATKENKDCLVISEQLQMKSNLHKDRIQFWDKFIVKYEAMATNGIVKDIRDEL